MTEMFKKYIVFALKYYPDTALPLRHRTIFRPAFTLYPLFLISALGANGRWKPRQFIVLIDSMSYWIKDSRFFNLINQSTECYSEEPWLPESGTFPAPSESSQPWFWSCRIGQTNWRTRREMWLRLLLCSRKSKKTTVWGQTVFGPNRFQMKIRRFFSKWFCHVIMF